MGQKQPNVNPALFFGGLIIGAMITAILTPSSGREMRGKIKSKTAKMSENMKKTTQDIKETAAETKSAAKEPGVKTAKKNDTTTDITPPIKT